MKQHTEIHDMAYTLESVSDGYMPTQQDAFRQLQALEHLERAMGRLRKILRACDPRDPAKYPEQ